VRVIASNPRETSTRADPTSQAFGVVQASAARGGNDGSVIDDPSDRRDLQAFGPAARRAIAAADDEAVALGHDRVGTEHLLLGLLADGSNPAAWKLREAGARLPLARRKVGETLPPSPQASRREAGPLPLSPRAGRALVRSERFAQERRAEIVTTVQLLMGVLYVEGTAGQVLRSLGIDVEHLLLALEVDDGRTPDGAVSQDSDHEVPAAKPLLCPACGTQVVDDLMYRLVRAWGEHGPRDAGVFSCGGCGTIIGVVPP